MSIVLWLSEYKDTAIPFLEKYGFLKNGVGSGSDRFGFWLSNNRKVGNLFLTSIAQLKRSYYLLYGHDLLV